ncbi:hypothetical protein Ancab_008929 [Ancistrocladus abbreviatus]
MSAWLLLGTCSLTNPAFASICIAGNNSVSSLRTATMLNQKRIASTRSRNWRQAELLQRAGGFWPKVVAISAALQQQQPLDLTEQNVKKVLGEARRELAQLFDESVGITGKAELAELDGPFVKIRLSGRFWHKRSTVLERLSNYLCQRIPEILEVDIEDEKQLDDSPENF